MTMLNHWTAVKQKHELLSEFVEWLEDELSIFLDLDEIDREKFPTLDSYTHSNLIDTFLEINRKQLEKERRELSEKIKSLQGKLNKIL